MSVCRSTMLLEEEFLDETDNHTRGVIMYQLLPLGCCGGVGLPPSEASAPQLTEALVPYAAGQFEDADTEEELQQQQRAVQGGVRCRTTPSLLVTEHSMRRGTDSGAIGGSNSVTPDLFAPETAQAGAARAVAAQPPSPEHPRLHPSHPGAFSTQPRLIGFVPALPAAPAPRTPTNLGFVSGSRAYTPIAPRGGMDRLLRVPIPSYAGRYFAAATASLPPPPSVPVAATLAAVAVAAGAAASPPHVTAALPFTVGTPMDATAGGGSAWASPQAATVMSELRPSHLHTPPHHHSGVGGSPPSAAAVVDAARAMTALRDRAPSVDPTAPDQRSQQPSPRRTARREDWDRLPHPSPIVCPFLRSPTAPPMTTNAVPATLPSVLPDVLRESDVCERRNPISTIGPRDILLGRGGQANHHCGNVWFRTVVTQYRIPYCVVAKGDKMQLARNLATYLYLCGARFLVKDGGPQYYYEAGHDTAAKKCSQALREGAAAVVRRTLQGSLAAVGGERGAVTTNGGGATWTAGDNNEEEVEEDESEEEEEGDDDDEASTASESSKSSTSSSSSSSSIHTEGTTPATSPSPQLGEQESDSVDCSARDGWTPCGSGSGPPLRKRRRAPSAGTEARGEGRSTRVKWEHWRKRPTSATARSERNG